MKKKSAIFKDKEVEKDFYKNGFATLPGFLNLEDCEKLIELYKQYCQNPPDKGMWFSSVHEKFSEAEALSNEIRSILEERIETYFEDHKVLLYTLADKVPKTGGFMHLHRDFSITDEEVFQYRNVWVPLIDVNEKNGTIYLAPGSQDKIDDYRWSAADSHNDHKYDAFKEDIMVYNASKGNALIYAERTLHGSFNNKSSFARPVVHFGLIHKEMPILKPKKEADGKIKLEETNLKGLLNVK